MNPKLFLSAILGTLAVIIGALGAHAIKSQISPEKFQSFQTGVHYQLFMALFLVIISILFTGKWTNGIFYTGFFGCLLFSFSIYALSTAEITGISAGIKNILGPITPIGGLLMISSWILLAISALSNK